MAANQTAGLGSSLLRKTVMGVTGLFLCLFLLVHLSGNFLLFKGPEAFNAYSDFMANNTFIRVNEIILVFGFLFHILDALALTLKNRAARPVGYAVSAGSANCAWNSRRMGLTGSIVLLFLVIHLRTFFVEHRILHVKQTMYDSVVEAFHSPIYSGFYVLAMILLGLHLNHGFQSAFQTLGLNHPRYTPWLKRIGTLFSILVPAGFASMPIYFYLQRLAG